MPLMLSSSETIELLDSLLRASKQRPRHASTPDASANLQLTERIVTTMLGRTAPDSSLPSLASILPKVVKLYDQKTLDLLDKLDGRRHLERSPPPARVGTLPSTLSSPSPPSAPPRFSFRTKSTVLPPKRPAGMALSDLPAPNKRPRTSASSDSVPRAGTGSPAPQTPTSSHRSDLLQLPLQRPAGPNTSAEADLRARIAGLEETVAAKDKLLADNDKEDAQRKSDYLTIRHKLEAALIDICDDPADLVEQGRLFRQLSISELTDRFVTYATESNTIAGLKEELRVTQDACTFEIDARKAEVEQLNKKLNRLVRERLQDNDNFATAAQDSKRDLASLRAKYTQVQKELASKERDRADLAAKLTAASAKLDIAHRRRLSSPSSNSNSDDLSSSSSAAAGVDAETVIRDLRAENARLKTDLAQTEKERVELAHKSDRHASVSEISNQRPVPSPPSANSHSASTVVESLLKPYEAVFWALEAVEARLADADVAGGERAVKKAKEKLRAMGPLWEEVEKRKGLA